MYRMLHRFTYFIKNHIKLTVLLACSVLLMTSLMVWFVVRSDIFLPKDIQDKVDYSVLYPTKDEVGIKNITYIDDGGVLSMQVPFEGRTFILNQQKAPDQFRDIDGYFTKFVEELNRYKSVVTVHGAAYLTKPTEYEGKTQAVMYANELLVFVSTKDELKDSEWRDFFNSLEFRG